MDHPEAILSIDSNQGLDLVASCSSVLCALRVISTNRFFRNIQIMIETNKKMKTILYRAMLSARGYLVIQARSFFPGYEKDIIIIIYNGQF